MLTMAHIEVPIIGDTFFGLPIIRNNIDWGLYRVPLIKGNSHVSPHDLRTHCKLPWKLIRAFLERVAVI